MSLLPLRINKIPTVYGVRRPNLQSSPKEYSAVDGQTDRVVNFIQIVLAGTGWCGRTCRTQPRARRACEVVSDASYQTYFAASTITTMTTMANMAICAHRLFARPRPFLFSCIVMMTLPRGWDDPLPRFSRSSDLRSGAPASMASDSNEGVFFRRVFGKPSSEVLSWWRAWW
jgi:hypothetical protein